MPAIEEIKYAASDSPFDGYKDECDGDWWKHGDSIQYSEIAQTESEPKTQQEKDFERLSKKWKQETSGITSVASMVMHPAYLEIISNGEKMIPYILKDLQEKPSHWFIALKILNKNVSPVRPEDAGNIKKMTAAWIAWGKSNGKLP